MINKGIMSSEKHDWETPQEFFDKLDLAFKFDIDVCANSINAKCKNYFTKEVDGLSQEWNGVCWCNPPYGKEQVEWIRKSVETTSDKTNTVCCFIPARPDTKVWHDMIFPNASAICFIKGRIKFSNKKQAPFPSALVVFGRVTNSQLKVLHTLGQVFFYYNKES